MSESERYRYVVTIRADSRGAADTIIAERLGGKCSDETLTFSDDDNGPGDWLCSACRESVQSDKWVEGSHGGRVPPLPANFPHRPRVTWQPVEVTRTGKILTPKDFERLADEAEGGYNVTELRDRRTRREAP